MRLSSDRAAILDHLGPGSFFGEQSLLPAGRGDQVAEAVSPVRVEAFGKPELLDRVQADRSFALRLLQDLVLRAGRYEQSIRDFVTEPIDRRLARRLLRLTPARPASGWVRLPWNPTNPELARMIGTTRWRISHFLNHFQRLGWLRREAVHLQVHREGLRNYLESPQHRS